MDRLVRNCDEQTLHQIEEIICTQKNVEELIKTSTGSNILNTIVNECSEASFVTLSGIINKLQDNLMTMEYGKIIVQSVNTRAKINPILNESRRSQRHYFKASVPHTPPTRHSSNPTPGVSQKNNNSNIYSQQNVIRWRPNH